jgi:polyferredoxin
MDRLGYPRGLIRYATERQLGGGRTRVLRPRIAIYGTLLATAAVGLLVALFLRVPLQLELIRDRNALYRTDASGAVENALTLRILNKDGRAHRFVVEVLPSAGLSVETSAPLGIPAATLQSIPARVRIEADARASAPPEVTIRVSAADDPALAAEGTLRLLLPGRVP